jgi:maltose alpha-D-glucosyltransferase/alpha-amylase
MNKLITYLTSLYKDDAVRVEAEISDYIVTLKQPEPQTKNHFWYKYMNLYTVYPDSIVYDKSKSPLQNLCPHMLYIRTLGCNAIHILPFLDSPMVDRGFDVSDFTKIRPSLGTLSDLQEVIKAAKSTDMQLFMDLVFNHVSDQHEWFIKAQQGDEKYRNYFITAKEKPAFIKKYSKDSAVWADYKVNGKIVTVNIAFPEFAGEIPHWREGKDGYWYYHTYYPEELDLNWANPEVFIEMAKIMLYWASFGFNFRLDAIPFVGKSAYKAVDGDNHRTNNITAALKHLSYEFNPYSVFLVESYESLDTIINYFGNANKVQADLAYNFHLCTNTWVSMIMHDPKYIWDKLDNQKEIPKHAEWLNFLRNHDELSLAYLPDSLNKVINKELMPKGKPFRENFGISGRTFSLLNKSVKRFIAAYFLLASFPGGIMMPYGDEIGYENIPLHKLSASEKRDTRNINRGRITRREFRRSNAKSIASRISSILEARMHLREYLNVWPEKIEGPKGVYAAVYRLGSSELLIYVNLSDKRKQIKRELNGFITKTSINTCTVTKDLIKLGPYAGVWLQR